MKVLIFKVSDCRCCLPTPQLLEVAPMATLLRPPGLPAVIEGFLNLAGCGLPVVRLDRLFGLTESRITLSTALIVLRSKTPLALMVDQVINVADVPTDHDIALSPGNTLNDCATGGWNDGQGLIHILSADRILMAEEQRRIAELGTQMQARLDAFSEMTTS